MIKKLYVDTNYITKPDKLFEVLSDEQWHSTAELVREVGHGFAHAKFILVGSGLTIEKRPHPTRVRQYQYRLVS